jgi:hypothetical protein
MEPETGDRILAWADKFSTASSQPHAVLKLYAFFRHSVQYERSSNAVATISAIHGNRGFRSVEMP